MPGSLKVFYDPPIYGSFPLVYGQYELVLYVIFMFIIILGFVAFRFCYTSFQFFTFILANENAGLFMAKLTLLTAT